MEGRKSNYKVNQSVQFRVLSDDQCAEIFQAALEVLERTGVNIHCEEALSLLKNAGSWVDGKRVRIPSHLVKKALHRVPARVVLCTRDGERKLFLEGHNSYFGPGPTNPYFIDVETGERRKVVKKDVENVAKVCEALPNIDFVMSLAMISDCTPVLADVHEVHAMLQNTTKPICTWAFNVENLKDIVEMCCAVAGGLENLQRNPFFSLYSEPIVPLTHPKEAVEKLLYMADMGLPQIYAPGMQMGGTVPMTIAGMLVVGLADNLVGLLLSQLKREGAPFIAGLMLALMDMQTTNCSYGAPEFSLALAAQADLYHFLKLPVWSAAGASDSIVFDEQAAVEAAIQCYSAALSGANLIHDVGFLESGLSASLEQLALGDEIIGMVRRIISGVEVNKDTLAVDVIDQVGPGGHFLGEEHTFKYFRQKTWFPTLMNRKRYLDWKNEGEKTMGMRLNEKARKILNEFESKRLPVHLEERLNEIMEKAEQRARKN
ncbi:trimethylamine methyltransferase family protein [Candidatus Formimonas warabiya]|uniref:Trimethylamine methyltransferase n=1 Tax=Formimonas warabiya TaxID=1761012 RepID=A0A3G1KVL3_FORW1|nr:trimethylamine methyltransferase family protein [Candidatus Formimonas warabiya]ATW26447.1 trimethylamine methyltransferase [Candidatus Formimonas warabiya]